MAFARRSRIVVVDPTTLATEIYRNAGRNGRHRAAASMTPARRRFPFSVAKVMDRAMSKATNGNDTFEWRRQNRIRFRVM
jgi:hypothetical protein